HLLAVAIVVGLPVASAGFLHSHIKQVDLVIAGHLHPLRGQQQAGGSGFALGAVLYRDGAPQQPDAVLPGLGRQKAPRRPGRRGLRPARALTGALAKVGKVLRDHCQPGAGGGGLSQPVAGGRQVALQAPIAPNLNHCSSYGGHFGLGPALWLATTKPAGLTSESPMRAIARLPSPTILPLPCWHANLAGQPT